MEKFKKIAPMLREMLDKKKCSAASWGEFENQLTLNILRGKRWKKYKAYNELKLIDDIRHDFQLG